MTSMLRALPIKKKQGHFLSIFLHVILLLLLDISVPYQLLRVLKFDHHVSSISVRTSYSLPSRLLYLSVTHRRHIRDHPGVLPVRAA